MSNIGDRSSICTEIFYAYIFKHIDLFCISAKIKNNVFFSVSFCLENAALDLNLLFDMHLWVFFKYLIWVPEL